MEMIKKKKKISFILIIIILISLAIYSWRSHYKSSLEPMTTDDSNEIVIDIPQGSSINKISDLLYENGLIKSKFVFKLQARSSNVASKLKAGQYELNTNMDLNTIIEHLTKGGKSGDTIRFTIPEGYELVQIADKLSEEGFVNKDKFIELTSNKDNFEDRYEFLKELDEGQSLEGYLFPSTYEIYKDAKEEDIVSKMLDEFDKVYKKDIMNKLDELDISLNEAVTLASIVEREAKVDSERPLVSAVFHNRLDKGMMLQSCATVQYILGERKENLSTAETQTPSPYNTYINKGLPPGPIASPGEKSLIAAVNPADVDYLFFVLTGPDGTHTFTTNYEDHMNAKPKK
ncbi:endolytic transglycosylase MltG [Paratissierella segnis]|mgnify:CR=1 FL=1|jgi:UPF0755 protein|uniref:Endolytic murein transglycosylase n=1 Tax=Paratissierella segnis TaxID=2763679 RepID=A0A926IKN0_9FIRM|nr:endolytic transglycosylase MltG [Paratissierella segnis]MBC8588465.1 endolytic transglycosylase MltG [Paratissierella segnis]